MSFTICPSPTVLTIAAPRRAWKSCRAPSDWRTFWICPPEFMNIGEHLAHSYQTGETPRTEIVSLV